MIRKMIRRLASTSPPDNAAELPGTAPKPGGHGDHWGCVVRATEQDDLLSLISDVIRESERPELFQATGMGMAVQSAGDGLHARVLVVDERLVSAYPEAEDGPVWPITITEVVPWANGIEGQLKGTCHGADVAFFD